MEDTSNNSKSYESESSLDRIIDDNVNNLIEENNAKQIEILQEELAGVRDGRDERIFWLLIVIVILFDCLAFQNLPIIGIILVFTLEIPCLICAGKRLGQDEALELLTWVKTMLEKILTK